MCAGGWAEEDPGRWSMTWYDTRCLFVNTFYPQNKSSVDDSSICFSPFTFSAVQVWPILTWEESSLNGERIPLRKKEKGQSLWFVEPCTSGYTACVHSRCAMKPVHLKLLVWTQTRGEKLCIVTANFTRKYPDLFVSRPNMDDRDLKTGLSVPKEPASLHCALLTSLCCAIGNASHQGYHWLRSFNVCNR